MRNPLRSLNLSSAACLLGLTTLAATPLEGQKSTTRGLNLGVHLQAASLSIQDGDADGGGGLGFRIGYGLNRIVTLYFEADGVSVDSEGSDVFHPGFPTWTLPSEAGPPASRT